MLGRYPEKRPQDLNVTCDGHMYLDDLIRAWGQQHGLQEEAVLIALRKYAARGEVSSRFTMTCTLGGRTIIKVSPKLPAGSRPTVERHYTLPVRSRVQPPRQTPKCNLDVKAKLDMSLDDLIGSSNGIHYSGSSSSSSSGWKNGAAAGYKTLGDATKIGQTALDSGKTISANAEQDVKSTKKWSLLDVTLNEAAGLLECNGPDRGKVTAQGDERSARVRRSMEQMGLTPATAHIRKKTGRKNALPDVTEVVDSSPSPPPDRGEAAQAGEDADDIALAACAARSLNVSGGVEIAAAAGAGKAEAPPRPPGSNWQQYFDSEDSSLWYFWPGPGGEWWCGPKEGDEPHPYKEGSAA